MSFASPAHRPAPKFCQKCRLEQNTRITGILGFPVFLSLRMQRRGIPFFVFSAFSAVKSLFLDSHAPNFPACSPINGQIIPSTDTFCRAILYGEALCLADRRPPHKHERNSTSNRPFSPFCLPPYHLVKPRKTKKPAMENAALRIVAP